MLLILGLLAAIVIGIMAFMAYAMVLTMMLIGAIVLGLCILLYYGVEQAMMYGNYPLLMTAGIVWAIALLLLLLHIKKRPPS